MSTVQPRNEDRVYDAHRSSAAGAHQIRVAMLVRNAIEYDTRVRKEAASLSRHGYEVRVFGILQPGFAEEDVDGEVTYRRVELIDATRGAYRRYQESSARAYKRRKAGFGVLKQRAKAEHRLRRMRADSQRHRVQASTRSALLRVLALHAITRLLRLELFARWQMLRARRVAFAGYRRSHRLRRRAVRAAFLKCRAFLKEPALHVNFHLSVREALGEYDPHVVHCHDLNTLLAGYLFTRGRDTRLVYDAHELELHANRIWTPWRRVVMRAVETLGIRAADAVITVAPLIAEELAATYRIRTPRVLLNSPPLGSLTAAPAVDLKRSIELPSDAKLVIYVGGPLVGRGLEETISALAFLPGDVHLGILGPRKPEREQLLRSAARNAGVEDRLHFFDPVPAPAVPATVSTADASVLPIQNVCRSYDLCLPNKLYDGVMAGLPLAVSNVRHLRQFVTEHEVGAVFDEREPRSIAEAILRLLREPPAGVDDGKRLASLQRSVAWECQEQVLVRLYQDLAAHPAEPAR